MVDESLYFFGINIPFAFSTQPSLTNTDVHTFICIYKILCGLNISKVSCLPANGKSEKQEEIKLFLIMSEQNFNERELRIRFDKLDAIR